MENREEGITPENWQERTLLQIGEEGLQRLERACVAVIGLGGVGAFAAEMLARAGVGSLIIADADVYNLTNKNRQLGALDSTIGKKKCEVMAARLQDINPDLKIQTIEEFLTEDSIASLLGAYSPAYQIDYVVDAIDTLAPKIALVKYCLEEKISLVSSMGAGAKYDATKIRLTDIKNSFNCPLAYMLRKRLHKEGIYTGFKVVFSEERPVKEAIIPYMERNKKSRTGTISYLPAVFGCVCAQAVITDLLRVNGGVPTAGPQPAGSI